VISELPKEWRTAVRRWARLNRKLKKTVDGQPAPSPNEEYFLYQTLLGVWPFEEEIPAKEYKELIERLQAYVRKALNEAKVNSSWINPNEPYQLAVADFIAAILHRDNDNRFLADFLAFQRKIAHYGAFNSLSQVLLKIGGPGVPDIYQGNEIWDFSLVDPDNRRPVDYKLRQRLLTGLEKIKDARGAAALLESLDDGRIKLFVTSRALNFRRDNFALFARGDYKALEVQGKYGGNLVAFSRSYGDRTALVVAPVLMSKLGRSGELTMPVGQVWSGSWLVVPAASEGDRYRNIFTGEEVEARAQNDVIALPVDQVLGAFPVALLEKV
jgi:(1->4)-alpha-D-glucan 1-alpha-D-glucosylmutase